MEHCEDLTQYSVGKICDSDNQEPLAMYYTAVLCKPELMFKTEQVYKSFFIDLKVAICYNIILF